MKKTFIILISSLLALTTTFANVKPNCKTTNCYSCLLQSAGIGGMITQLAGGLKSSAFSKDWSTKSVSFLNRMKQLSPTDVTGSASSLFEFSKFLKPSIFADTWKTQKGDFLKGVSAAKSTADIGRLFTMLLSNIKPGNFTKEFKAQADGLKMSAAKLGSN